LVVGRYDPNDFLDVLGYANPWTSFQNLAILFNASIALPDWGSGIGAGHWFNDQWYGLTSISDANGVATETRFFHATDELYKTAEFGWSPSRGERYFTNIHVTIWDVDERKDAGVPQSDGYTLSANWTFNQKLMLFTKYGSSDGAAPLYNESFTVGLIYYVAKRTDLFGLAMNWGEPVGSNENQVTTEMFYRLQLAQNLAITPSVQLVSDPAANPDEDEILFTGIRVRFSF
jgi:porin